MFKKTEAKQAESHSTLTSDELAQKVNDNAARVERQRKEIEEKEYRLFDLLNKPAVERTPRVQANSFDAKEIEKQAKVYESQETIFAKINALDDALAHPQCCDREYLNSIREYLQSIRPEVDAMEGKQWNLIRRIQELNNQIQQLKKEYGTIDVQIEDLLKVAHLTHWGREYDKTEPMNGLWCISGSKPVTGIVDKAVSDCQDGEKYAIGRNFSIPATPLHCKCVMW